MLLDHARAAAAVLAVMLALPAAGPAAGGEMTFDHQCLGNHVDSCFFTASGEITADTPQKFRNYWEEEGYDGYTLYLHSGGGSLEGGIELGQIFRDLGLSTLIGDPDRAGPDGWPGPGRCASACAYAFLGGSRRAIPEGSLLGFHQFFIAGKRMVGGSQGLSMAQNSAAGIVQYLVAMGIDARVFGVASQALPSEMIWFGHGEGEDYALVTPTGYEPLAIEPYRDGIVAFTRRKDPTTTYDLVHQISAFCRPGKPALLFTADFVPDRGAAFHISIDGTEFEVGESAVTARPSADGSGVLQVGIPQAVADRMAAGRLIETWFDFGMAEGGDFSAYLELSERDRTMLKAAFRFCI